MKTILFDLDGTLLPMDLMEFVENYYKLLAQYVARLGYDPRRFVQALNVGVDRMMHNDGSKTNEEIFWSAIAEEFGPEALENKAVLEEFYHNDFQQMKNLITPDPRLVDLVKSLKGKARLVLATNPLFPQVATHYRLQFAGFDVDDFERITTYEDAYHSKPAPAYYQSLIDELDIDPDKALMIGNDAIEDGAATMTGLPVFLIKDHILNEDQQQFEVRTGSIEDLKKELEEFLHV